MTAAQAFVTLAGCGVLAWLTPRALNWADARWWTGPRDRAEHAARMARMAAHDEEIARAGGCTHDTTWCCDTCWEDAAP